MQNQETGPRGRNLSPFKPACYKVFLCKDCPVTGTSKQLCRGRCEVVPGVCPSACAPEVQRNPRGLQLLSHKCLPHGLHSCISVRIWLPDIVLVQEPVLFVKQTSKRFVSRAAARAGQAKPIRGWMPDLGSSVQAFWRLQIKHNILDIKKSTWGNLTLLLLSLGPKSNRKG